MKELKPCPFCGEKAETHETTDGWIVSCSSDQNVLDGFTHMAHGYGGTEAEAIDAWNTRVERTCKNVSSRQTPWKCSACGGAWFHGWNFEPLEFRYCPDCGAKVVGECES